MFICFYSIEALSKYQPLTLTKTLKSLSKLGILFTNTSALHSYYIAKCEKIRNSFIKSLGGGFFLACEDVGRMFDIQSPPALFFFFLSGY